MYGSIATLEHVEPTETRFHETLVETKTGRTAKYPPLFMSYATAIILFGGALFAYKDSLKQSVDEQIQTNGASLFAMSDSSVNLTSLANYVEVSNTYGTGWGSSYPWASSFLALVEPHRQTTFSYMDSTEEEKRSYTWTIEGEEFHGRNVTFKFKIVSRKFPVSVVVKDKASGAKILSGMDYVFTKYVRRELRNLNDDDRTRWFSTLRLLYEYNTTEGRLKFGHQFKSAYDFVRIHNSLSGHLDCDHLHGGLGFLSQHAAMTYAVELSMQSIDARVSMAYWDFTIEEYRMSQSGAGTTNEWYEVSELWNDDWFGPMGSANDSYVVTSGTFKYLKSLTDAWALVDPETKLETVTNAWGLMRSPWNTNKVPYLSRSRSSYGFFLDTSLVPGCSNHYDIMKQESWSGFGDGIQEAPHGSLHILVGGTWNADYNTFLQMHNYSSVRARPFGTVTLARIWREGWLECPTFCAMDAAPESCKCSCPNLETWIADNQAKKMLKNMYPGLASAPDFLLDDNNNDISEVVLRMLCNDYDGMNPHVGDFMQSSSPVEPVFWPTHPTLDRLWHWRKLNGFLNEDWADGGCWGHNINDTTIWHDLFNEESGDFYTVGDIMDSFSPMSLSVPYVYDDFEWPHCEAQGYPLTLIESTPSTSDSSDSWDNKGTRSDDASR